MRRLNDFRLSYSHRVLCRGEHAKLRSDHPLVQGPFRFHPHRETVRPFLPGTVLVDKVRFVYGHIQFFGHP